MIIIKIQFQRLLRLFVRFSPDVCHASAALDVALGGSVTEAKAVDLVAVVLVSLVVDAVSKSLCFEGGSDDVPSHLLIAHG